MTVRDPGAAVTLDSAGNHGVLILRGRSKPDVTSDTGGGALGHRPEKAGGQQEPEAVVPLSRKERSPAEITNRCHFRSQGWCLSVVAAAKN